MRNATYVDTNFNQVDLLSIPYTVVVLWNVSLSNKISYKKSVGYYCFACFHTLARKSPVCEKELHWHTKVKHVATELKFS